MELKDMRNAVERAIVRRCMGQNPGIDAGVPPVGERNRMIRVPCPSHHGWTGLLPTIDGSLTASAENPEIDGMMDEKKPLVCGTWNVPGVWENIRNSVRISGLVLVILLVSVPLSAQVADREVGHTLTISGTRFLMDGKPFPYAGLSFFNAIYNPTFNRDTATRQQWLKKFREYGINVLRVWCQWDNGDTFVDAGDASTLFVPDGTLRAQHLATLKAILADAERVGMCLEITLFAQESFLRNIHLGPPADERAVAALTQELAGFRNATFQIWNEHSDPRVPILVDLIHRLDPGRLVTNSPGYDGDLGNDADNRRLDYLTPHTSRSGRPWEIAPREIALLLARFGKPVVDDEPARNGTAANGGPKAATSPFDHMLQIHEVWQAGGYPTYHHDMFQTGYGSPACPPSGIPDPAFNPYHRTVLEFLRNQERFAP